MSQRDNCGQCMAPILRVYVGSRRTILDWPWAEHGDIAVYTTVAGTYSARYCPVGETLHAAEKRYRVHSCGEPLQDLSEPVRSPEPVTGPVPAGQVKAWKAAVARHQAELRNRRGTRPGKPITGYRINPGGSK